MLRGKSAGRSQVGVFTVSLDCEGLWGMADSAETFREGRINRASLDDAYRFLQSELDRYSIRATAAFVSCFGAPHDAARTVLPELQALARKEPIWFERLLPRLQDGRAEALSGLEGDRYWSAFAKAGHEMAWHGATHLPLVPSLDPEALELELRISAKLNHTLGTAPTSIVFPRNKIGHLSTLKDAGFLTYRDSRKDGFDRRLMNLLGEWNAWDRGDDVGPCLRDGWGLSPAGYFLNWPSGIRRAIPVSVTVARWKSMLRAASEHGRYVHMWFHPHNLITAPTMKTAFSSILNFASDLVRLGDIKVMTMNEAHASCLVG